MVATPSQYKLTVRQKLANGLKVSHHFQEEPDQPEVDDTLNSQCNLSNFHTTSRIPNVDTLTSKKNEASPMDHLLPVSNFEAHIVISRATSKESLNEKAGKDK